MPRQCRAAKGLECIFPIRLTQWGRVRFTLAMPCSDHAVLFKATAQLGRRETAVLWRGLEKNCMVRAWHGCGMASVNQTRPHCVNRMGKTYSKPLAARHGRGTAWVRHGHGMLCVNRPLFVPVDATKACGEAKVLLHSFWTATVYEGEWSTWHSSRFIPGKAPVGR